MNQITILIPTMYRASLPRAITSVLAQTQQCDLVVVSDLLHSGAGPTRNRGMAAVRTEWVGFLDDDDILFNNYAELLSKNFADADLVLGRIQVRSGDHGGTVPRAEITDPSQLKRGEAGMSFCVKTELARQFPFKNEFDVGAGEDWLFIENLRELGYKIVVIEETVYHVRPFSG